MRFKVKNLKVRVSILLFGLVIAACGVSTPVSLAPTLVPPTSTPAPPTSTPIPPTPTPAPPTPTAVSKLEEKLPTATQQTGDTIKLTDTPTPLPTDTPTVSSTPAAIVTTDVANLRSGPGTNYAVVGQSSQGNVLAVTGRDATPPEWWRIVTADGQEAWIFAELVDVRNAEEILVVAAPPTPTAAPQQPATEESSSSWVLVADSTHDFLGPIQDRQWAYFWSKGRNNYHFEEMTEMPNQCYHSPNDMTLEICRDQMTVDIHARGDAALQWKARESGSYRFEWDSDVVDGETTLRFSKQLEFLESQGPGSELPYSVTVYNVDQWEIFYWVPQYDTHYQVKIYKWQGEGESPRPTVEPSPVPPLAEATHILYFYFGAEGCPFSKSMAPKVERFHQEYGLATILPNEWNTGIGVLAALPPIQQADPRIEVKGVKVDWWGGSVNKFVRDTGITFPVVNDPGLSVDKSTFPITVVFNKQTGTHRVATRGDVSFADLESKVNAILDGEDVKPAQGGA